MLGLVLLVCIIVGIVVILISCLGTSVDKPDVVEDVDTPVFCDMQPPVVEGRNCELPNECETLPVETGNKTNLFTDEGLDKDGWNGKQEKLDKKVGKKLQVPKKTSGKKIPKKSNKPKK